MHEIPRKQWPEACARFSREYQGRHATVTITEPGEGGHSRTVWRDRWLQRVALEEGEETVLSIVASSDKAGQDPICYRVEAPTHLATADRADTPELLVIGHDGWSTEVRLKGN